MKVRREKSHEKHGYKTQLLLHVWIDAELHKKLRRLSVKRSIGLKQLISPKLEQLVKREP